MSTITTQNTQDGYTKSLVTPKGTITAYVQTMENGKAGMYIERLLQTNKIVEKENMMSQILADGIRINENNLDAVLFHLHQQQVV